MCFFGQHAKRSREQYLVQLAREHKDIIPCDGHIAMYVTPVCPDTVNVDIFACIHFRAFPKIGNFARIYFRVFDIIASM